MTAALAEGKKFRLIVVDSRPKLAGDSVVSVLFVTSSGERFAKACFASGIKLSYCYVSAISYVMRQVTKVFLSAHAMLSNGSDQR